MTWQDDCYSPISRYRASREDDDLNDAEFCVEGVKMVANRTILAMASPVLKTQFYGSLAVEMGVTVPIDDGTKRGFKAMLEFIYNEGEYSTEDLLGGKDVTNWNDLEKVLELLYFAHKYQINSLVSFGRGILLQRIEINDTNVMKIHREIVAYRTILTSEYGIVNKATKDFIGNQFANIFKHAQVNADVFLPQDLMMELLKGKSLKVSEGFVLQVALAYTKFCKDKALAKRMIPEVIDFTKLTLDEVDLTQVSAMLPEDIIFKMQTAMITSYKRGLRAPVIRTENPGDYTISLAKIPLVQLPARQTSQIKFKVNKSCFILFNDVNRQRGDNYDYGYNFNYDYDYDFDRFDRFDRRDRRGHGHGHGHAEYQQSCKRIVWKQNGTLKQEVEGQQVSGAKFFADPDNEITVDFEMYNSSVTYLLENENGKFKTGDVELTVLEVNEESFSKKADGKGAKLLERKVYMLERTGKEGLHVVTVTILPM